MLQPESDVVGEGHGGQVKCTCCSDVIAPDTGVSVNRAVKAAGQSAEMRCSESVARTLPVGCEHFRLDANAWWRDQDSTPSPHRLDLSLTGGCLPRVLRY